MYKKANEEYGKNVIKMVTHIFLGFAGFMCSVKRGSSDYKK